jgi:hypothetical protein
MCCVRERRGYEKEMQSREKRNGGRRNIGFPSLSHSFYISSTIQLFQNGTIENEWNNGITRNIMDMLRFCFIKITKPKSISFLFSWAKRNAFRFHFHSVWTLRNGKRSKRYIIDSPNHPKRWELGGYICIQAQIPTWF